MRLRLIRVILLALVALPAGRALPAELEGCPDVSLLAKALTELRHSDWHEVSVGRLQAMWPTELLGVDCNSNACSSVESKGRIINGRYECSEIFFFDVKQGKDGTSKTELKNVVIHYSAPDRKEVAKTARLLAGATGLSDAESATVGREPQQDFHWEDAETALLSGLSVEIKQKGAVWTVSLNLSRYPK